MKRINLLTVLAVALCFFAAESWGQLPAKGSAVKDKPAYPPPDFTARKWTGDLDGMIKNRVIRVLVTYNKTHYFVDRGTQRGLAYDFGRLFEEDLNKKLFAFAAYNAGPGRISQLRGQAAKRGLNPNVWFNNVEVIAAEKIGRETVTHVSNIYKYYIAYKLVTEEMEARQEAKEEVKKQSGSNK